MLRIAVCDDERDSSEATRRLAEKWSAETSVSVEIDCFDNGDSLLRENRHKAYDLIFLDIIMPLLSGMDTARELRETDKRAKIVFLTSSPEFALESYSVKAADYCLKPLSYAKIQEILSECAPEREPDSLTLKTVTGYRKIYLHDIEYAEARNKRVCFCLRNGESTEVPQPLYTFETILTDDKGFFKCHRSYLVYIPNVSGFNGTEIVTKSGRRIPIARGCGKSFRDAYFNVMFRE